MLFLIFLFIFIFFLTMETLILNYFLIQTG